MTDHVAAQRRRPWQRRLIVGAAVLVAVAALRTGCSLWPPTTHSGLRWSALTGVTVINPGHDRRENQTITMRGDRIESIRDRVPDSGLMPRTMSYDKRYVLPGLIDLDVRRLPGAAYLQRMFGAFFLAAGVTTVRVTGDFAGSIGEVQRRSAAGELPWPRLVACGRVLEGDPPACANGRVVRDEQDARHAVDELTAAGAACVAVRWNLGGTALAAVRAAAASKGLPVVGDIPVGVSLAIAGLNDAYLLSTVSPAVAPPRPADWIRSWYALDAGAIAALVQSAAAQGTAYTPNLQRWSQLAAIDAARHTPELHLLPRLYRERIWPQELAEVRGELAGGGERALAAHETAQAVQNLRVVVGGLHAAGVRIQVGSATPSAYVMPGSGLWLEMVQLAGAGLTLEETWRAATRSAGEALGIPQLGAIEPGAPADLLVFGKDPTRDLDGLLSLEVVISRGRLYARPFLERSVLAYFDYVSGPAYDWASRLAPDVVMRWQGVQSGACDTP